MRSINALQFRDGMRGVFSYYASIRSDPYNFDHHELVCGPASVLFGQSALGGIVNIASKRPEFEAQGEISLRYGSFDRETVLVDVTSPVSDAVATRPALRARDADTRTS